MTDELNTELEETMAKAAVLSARAALNEIQEATGLKLDLRSFMVGGLLVRSADIPIPNPIIVEKMMEELGPELDRQEMLENVEGAFDDLPTFDPENGS